MYRYSSAQPTRQSPCGLLFPASLVGVRTQPTTIGLTTPMACNTCFPESNLGAIRLVHRVASTAYIVKGSEIMKSARSFSFSAFS
jgi:hypothetical protein